MKFPEWWQAPVEILEIDGHCGLIAAWSVLRHFRRRVSVSRIISSCRHTKRYGVFTVNLAAGLKELGLQVSFHTEDDDDIGDFEKRGYDRARRLGVSVNPPVDLTALLRQRRFGRVPIVLYNMPSGSGHFSTLLGARGNVLHLPLADNGRMPMEEFLSAWSAPKILRQCVVVWR